MAFALANTCDVINFLKCSLRVKRIDNCKLNCALVALSTNNCLHKLASSLNCLAVSNQNRKKRPFEVDRTARAARRAKPRTVKQTHILQKPTGEMITRTQEYNTSQDDSEARQILLEAARSFVGTIEFYKSEFGGGKPHDEAVKEALQCHEWRRGYVEGLSVEEIGWGHISAVGEVNLEDACKLWGRVREAADDELESGKRGARVAGDTRR